MDDSIIEEENITDEKEESEPEVIEDVSSSEDELLQCDPAEVTQFVEASQKTIFGSEAFLKDLHTSDPFDEDQAELKFLASKPVCILVIGKPGSGKSKLASKLASIWNARLISPIEVLQEQINRKTDIGKKAKEMLMTGESVDESLIIQMLKDKLQSETVKHYGYILDGFPFPCQDTLQSSEQIEFIKNLSLQPTVIINLRIPDQDLLERRCSCKVDPQTNVLYAREKYSPDKPPPLSVEDKDVEEGEEEDYEEMEEEPNDDNDEYAFLEDSIPDLSEEFVQNLVTRPEDMADCAASDIQYYKRELLTLLEDMMANHDQQFVVEIDANIPEKSIMSQLMMKLNTLPLQIAIPPIPLNNPEEDLKEDMDYDELIRTISTVSHPGPRWRWRRSRWGRFCPVALKKGQLVWGKPEFTAAFLDKVYVMSSASALRKFMENPRLYLLPPQPQPPCRLAIVGPHLSGKTTLAKLLGRKYNAKVINIEKLLKPKAEQIRQQKIEEHRKVATENAMQTVKKRLEDAQKAEAEARAQELLNEAEDGAAEDNRDEEREGDNVDDADEKDPEADEEEDGTTKSEADADEGSHASKEDQETEQGREAEPEKEELPPIEVDETHPDCVAIIEESVKTFSEKLSVDVPAEDVVNLLQLSIRRAKKKHQLAPDICSAGYIIDGFPNSVEQWTAFVEKSLVLDEVICCTDSSEGGKFLLDRYFHLNRETIQARIRERQLEEERRRRELEEEARRIQEEAERKKREEEEEAARILAEEQAAKREELQEDTEEVPPADDDQKPEDQGEAEEEEAAAPVPEDETKDLDEVAEKEKDTTDVELEKVDIHDSSDAVAEEVIPYDAPEMEAYKVLKNEFEKNWPAINTAIANGLPIEPKIIQIADQTCDDILDKTTKEIETQFTYKAWEFAGVDMDEEEEDIENDQDGEDEVGTVGGEEEEEEDVLKKKKRPLGDTSHYCPVELKRNGVLFPGNSEIAAKYREKTYYLSSAEAREDFIADPKDFVAGSKCLEPPPLRILLLGPRGAGKTIFGKELSKELGIFYISFMDRLQELVLAKTKKPILKAGEDEELEEEKTLTEDDISAIIAAEAKLAESDANKSENEEIPVEFTEDEEAVKNYLAEDEPLHQDVLEAFIKIGDWWHQEPYKSSGFVLEAFPHLRDEVSFLQSNGLYPDCAVVLNIEEEDVIKRLMPARIKLWRTKRDRKLRKKNMIKERKAADRAKAMDKRREEILAEREARKEERKKQGAGDDEEEDEEEEDIEQLLAEEFEDEENLEEEEDDETEVEAIDRMRTELSDRYEDETNKLQGVIESLDEFYIPKIEINAGRKPSIVRYLIKKALKHVVEDRKSLFERVNPISSSLAKRITQCGYKQLSKFGKWDPVALKNGDCIQPLSDIYTPTYPAIYRQHIYFFSTKENRTSFMNNVNDYLGIPPPRPSIPIHIAIIGPPKSGKSSVAARFVEKYGMMRLSIGEAIRLVLNTQPKTHLAQEMNNFLQRGYTLPDELAVRCLQVALMDMRCQARGFVLDGYPVTMRQVELLKEQSIIPFRVIELSLPPDDVLIRGAMDRTSKNRVLPLHDSHQILALRLAAWSREAEEIRDYYKIEHDNYHQLDATNSKWWLWKRCRSISMDAVNKLQIFQQRTNSGQAANIWRLGITPSEFISRLGEFEQYCPVSLGRDGELWDCSDQPDLSLAAQFRGKYYRCASEEALKEFLSTPDVYVFPQAVRPLPPAELLPKRRTQTEVKALFPKQIELQGYCPVTFIDGCEEYEAIVAGDCDNLVAEYKDRLYCFASENALSKFMRLPEKYFSAVLPKKLPPKRRPLAVGSLPMLGYLEQTAATAIIKAMVAAGNVKPKFPFVSPSRSALLYVAFHLKAHNPNSSEYRRKKYKNKLRQFENQCELIDYLSNNMTINYRSPPDRPLDFDNKMSSFLQLKESTPTFNWIS